MENASKALLMAGGVLLVMLIIGVLLFARGRIAEYYNSEKDLVEIRDVTEFNSEFANYDRDDVYGYELLSLSNRVADYNMRFSNAAGSQNDLKYSPITLIIEMDKNKVKDKIAYGSTARLFTATNYNTSLVNNGFINIFNQLTALENQYGKENLQNLSKAIGSIFPDETTWQGTLYTDEYKTNLKKEVVLKFNSITPKKNANALYNTIKNCNYENDTSINTAYNSIQNNFKDVSYKYYEYTQFKKAKFESVTINTKDMYDSTTGRIKQMKFRFTGEVE